MQNYNLLTDLFRPPTPCIRVAVPDWRRDAEEMLEFLVGGGGGGVVGWLIYKY